VVFSIQIKTIGGSNETEQNDETVIPCNRPFESLVVTTVTPLANRDIAALKSPSPTAISNTKSNLSLLSAQAVRHRSR